MKIKANFDQFQTSENGVQYAVFRSPSVDVPMKIKVTDFNIDELKAYEKNPNITVRIEVHAVHYNGQNFLGFSL